MMLAVGFPVIGTGEKFYQHHTRHEASDMRPKSHAANVASKGGQAAHKLNEQPVDEHHPLVCLGPALRQLSHGNIEEGVLARDLTIRN